MWVRHAAKLVKLDLEAATAETKKADPESGGIHYVVQGRDGPEYADFHSLRHSYVSMLARSGIAPKLAVELARHSDIRLTMNRYAHVTLQDRAEAVRNLPSVLSAGRSSSAPDGPEGGQSLTLPLTLSYPILTLAGDGGRGAVMADEETPEGEEGPATPSGARGLRADEVGRGEKRPRPDSNRGMTVLQTVALPLGDEAANDSINCTGAPGAVNPAAGRGCPFRFWQHSGGGPQVAPFGRVAQGDEFDQRANVFDAPPGTRPLQPQVHQRLTAPSTWPLPMLRPAANRPA